MACVYADANGRAAVPHTHHTVPGHPQPDPLLPGQCWVGLLLHYALARIAALCLHVCVCMSITWYAKLLTKLSLVVVVRNVLGIVLCTLLPPPHPPPYHNMVLHHSWNWDFGATTPTEGTRHEFISLHFLANAKKLSGGECEWSVMQSIVYGDFTMQPSEPTDRLLLSCRQSCTNSLPTHNSQHTSQDESASSLAVRFA